MNQKVLRTLEYDKITSLLAAQSTSEAGRARCEALRPSSDIGRIQSALAETGDAVSRVLRCGDLSFAGTRDPESSVKRLAIGGTLNSGELLGLADLLEVAGRAKNYARGTDAQDSLDGMFHSLEPLTPLKEEIRRCMPAPDEFDDNATPALFSIRSQIHGMGERIRGVLNGIINNATTRAYLQDAVITLRGDRYCLPVKAECKSQMPGMIHDQSASGATFFIEPTAVVNLNNELKELLQSERAEIDRILASLSAEAAEHTPEITADYELLATLDFIFAKAKLALAQNAMPPEFNTEGRLHIRKGRHPLLDPEQVVPIDVWLGDGFRLLVITGPNTGGKTVTLKTIGLLTLMGQAGLFIPAGEHSELAVFRQVFADIGDEQSIEQSLSTFSSHMTNIVSILKKANRDSLVLLDELCAGTDPEEGAALATAILERLRRWKVPTVCTTHYSELKLYALQTAGVENACCEFDVASLSPTYRLLIGMPGKSNAFAISERLGLHPQLIENARSHVSAETERFEDVLADLESRRRATLEDQTEAARQKAEVEAQMQALAAKEERLDSDRDRILREANEEAAAILKNAKDVADESIRNFRKYGSTTADAAALERERDKVRAELSKAQEAAAVPKKTKQRSNAPEKLRVGDRVRILDLNLTGTVHTLPDEKGNLTVQAGILSYQTNVNDLALLEEEEPTAAASRGYAGAGAKSGAGSGSAAGQGNRAKSRDISPEINLIGKTVDEALPALDKYLDDAYLAHLPSVRIVHGKGTGALRSAVQDYLRRQNFIADYHLGEVGEGDSGVTIAIFK